MKFEIACASGKEPPCKGAYQGKAKWTNSFGPQEEDVWFIDMDPTHLLTFAKHHGSIILPWTAYDDKAEGILIYDSYVE